MRVFLIRHAQSQGNINQHLVGGRSSATPLSEEGVRQAERLGHALRDLDAMPTLVASSPAIRAQETARLSLATVPNAPAVRIEEALQEMSQGKFEGQPRDQVYTSEIKSQIDARGKDFSLPDSGAESMNDVANRMELFLQQLTATMQSNDVAYVYTHGIAICCYIGKLLSLSQQEIFERTRTLSNASYTELLFSRSGEMPAVVSFGRQ